MPDLLWLIIVIALLFLFAGALAVLVKKLERAKAAGSAQAGATEEPDAGLAAPYKLKDGVLSGGERAFYPALQEAVRLLAESRRLPLPAVFPSVRFAEILAVGIPQSENRSLWQTAHNQITNKQADFVICHPESTKPLMIVELDDQSHVRADRKSRDTFIDRACASAGLPILHVRAAARYDPKQVAAEIAARLPVRG